MFPTRKAGLERGRSELPPLDPVFARFSHQGPADSQEWAVLNLALGTS